MRHWLILLFSVLGNSANAQFVFTTVTSSCDAFRSPAFQDQHYETRIANCERLIRSGEIPNAQALNYTLKYLAQNYKGLKDSNCAMDGLEKDMTCLICKNPSQVRKGIQNGCAFVLNDLNAYWAKGYNRTTGYYVDLCQSDTGPSVTKFYINVGTGTLQKKHFVDIPDLKTTLPGAFLTDEKIVPFKPYEEKPYQELSQKLAGEFPGIQNKSEVVVPGIRLVGLNSSNNSSEDSKPMHISPFRTSSGCPSVGPESLPIMKKLVQSGSALLMNYHSEKYEQKASCHNDGSSPAGARSNSGATVGGAH